MLEPIVPALIRSLSTPLLICEQPGSYTTFVLYKENIDTTEAIVRICELLRLPPKRFSYAGTKDKRAITTQEVRVKGVTPLRISQLNKAFHRRGQILLGNANTDHKEPLLLGQLSGTSELVHGSTWQWSIMKTQQRAKLALQRAAFCIGCEERFALSSTRGNTKSSLPPFPSLPPPPRFQNSYLYFPVPFCFLSPLVLSAAFLFGQATTSKCFYGAWIRPRRKQVLPRPSRP